MTSKEIIRAINEVRAEIAANQAKEAELLKSLERANLREQRERLRNMRMFIEKNSDKTLMVVMLETTFDGVTWEEEVEYIKLIPGTYKLFQTKAGEWAIDTPQHKFLLELVNELYVAFE